MKIATISILICCIWTVSSAIQPQEQIQPDERTTIQSTIEAGEGSPVALSNPQYDLVKRPSILVEANVVGHVRIDNISDRQIRLLYLSFAYNMGLNQTFTGIVTFLGPRESRDYDSGGLTIQVASKPSDIGLKLDGMTLRIAVTGAEFQDGSHWAAPRTQSRPFGSLCLVRAEAYLKARRCRFDGSGYEALFEVQNPAIVAYRLGTVTDTESRFEVSLGEWTDLQESDRRQGAVVEPGRSLKGINKVREPDGDGEQITSRARFGVFVAEVRFADGHVWRQDTRREELVWDH